MNFRQHAAFPHAGIQIAPLIDIMFLLLIFFMVAAIYAQWEMKMDITVPTAESGRRADRMPGEIILNVDPDGSVVINGFKLEMPALRARLTAVAELHKDQPVIIRADGRTPHAGVMAVLDTCRLAGIWNIAFATLPKPAEK